MRDIDNIVFGEKELEDRLVDIDITEMQDRITGNKVYLTRESMDKYYGDNMSDVLHEVVTKYPYYDSDRKLRYGTEAEWSNRDTTLSSGTVTVTPSQDLENMKKLSGIPNTMPPPK